MYKKMQLNPYDQKWQETGKALISDDEAATLNLNTVFTGVKYEKEDVKKTVKNKK